MTKTVIVGAGVAGLTAAYYLHKSGRDYQIIEATDRVGGRIKTDIVDGYRLDRGFQVFLTAYPEAKRILEYNSLDLQSFDPGAVLLRDGGKKDYIGDPLRQFSSLFSTLTTNAASIGDKFNILRIKSRLTRQSINEVFEGEEVSTKQALREEYGFSNTIIKEFLHPFYAGIFLENDLSTSRRMFDFVFKMFTEGDAAIPALGMEEIPKQIASHLDPTKIMCNTRVSSIDGNMIYTDKNQTIHSDHILIATEATGISNDFSGNKTEHRSTTNLYFKAKEVPYQYNAIALNGASDSLVNNMVCLSKTSSQYAKQGHLISVSLKDGVDHNQPHLIQKVKDELAQWIISAKDWKHIKTYRIEYALPSQIHVNNDKLLEVSKTMAIIGDHTMNGSINAAMKSGRIGAEWVIDNTA
ncbi:MAG: protoporphyrinogen oxidase [Saprospiraceae bacterium]|jgi:protoporphyrinogen oxidase